MTGLIRRLQGLRAKPASVANPDTISHNTEPQRPGCLAPFTSLYLDPKGIARVCCQNEWVRLGSVTELGLHELWTGDRAERIRAAVRRGDWSNGCEQCGTAIALGGPESAYARVFDHLDDGAPIGGTPPWPVQLELALSNRCNLSCVMCNGELSSSIRSQREGRPPLATVYDDQFFEQLDDFLPHLRSVVFLGGEPFLGREPLRVMERLVHLGLVPSCNVTTNGTIWNERIDRLLRHLPFHVTVSVDGRSAAVNEAIRVGVHHAELERNVVSILRTQREMGRTLSLAFTLLRANWFELADVLRWADELEVDVFVNFAAHPPAQSLIHAPKDELARIISTLEADGYQVDRDRRNHAVWQQELQSLRDARDHRSASVAADSPAVPVAISRNTTRAMVLAGPDQLVRQVDAGETAGFGLRLDELVGEPLWSLVGQVSEVLGEADRSSLERMDDGGELREVHFVGPVYTTLMSARLSTEHDGSQRWDLRFKRSYPISTAVSLRS